MKSFDSSIEKPSNPTFVSISKTPDVKSLKESKSFREERRKTIDQLRGKLIFY